MLYSPSTYSSQIPFKRRDLCLKKAKDLVTVAWALLSNYCARILMSLKKVLHSEDFAIRHKADPKDFTRNRKLPFPTLICLLSNFVKSSYQNELDHFFKALGQFPVAKRIVTKPALTQARKKLKHEAFIELNQHLIQCRNPGPQDQVRVQRLCPLYDSMLLQDRVVPTTIDQGVTIESIQKVITDDMALPVPYRMGSKVPFQDSER